MCNCTHIKHVLQRILIFTVSCGASRFLSFYFLLFFKNMDSETIKRWKFVMGAPCLICKKIKNMQSMPCVMASFCGCLHRSYTLKYQNAWEKQFIMWHNQNCFLELQNQPSHLIQSLKKISESRRNKSYKKRKKIGCKTTKNVFINRRNSNSSDLKT